MKKIALEEHFTTQAYFNHLRERKHCPRLEAGPDGRAQNSACARMPRIFTGPRAAL